MILFTSKVGPVHSWAGTIHNNDKMRIKIRKSYSKKIRQWFNCLAMFTKYDHKKSRVSFSSIRTIVCYLTPAFVHCCPLCRMPASLLMKWAAAHGGFRHLILQGDTRLFGGSSEAHCWSYSPLKTCLIENTVLWKFIRKGKKLFGIHSTPCIAEFSLEDELYKGSWMKIKDLQVQPASHSQGHRKCRWKLALALQEVMTENTTWDTGAQDATGVKSMYPL